MLPAAAMLTGTVSGSRAGDANGLQAINGLEKSLVFVAECDRGYIHML